MNESKIYLVRSPSSLIKDNLAGYGWPQINFSESQNINGLLARFSEKSIHLGRQTNQIKRFFSIAEGDIVLVPVYRAVVIGFATGAKSYSKEIAYGENRIGVEYLRHETGAVIRIPRDSLSEALSTRLRIRMSVVSLNEFKDEINRIVSEVKSNGGMSFDSYIQQLESEALSSMQSRILTNIRTGKTNLQSGGIGLEKLVCDLLSTEGYASKVLGKATFEGVADADIEAFKEDRFSSTKLLIQVKHHEGFTGLHALRQLQNLSVEEGVQRWLITSGSVNQDLMEEADSHGIGVMNGEQLAEWIVDRAHKLSPYTLNRLGISMLPTLLVGND